jgi:hypothetical protein
VLVAAGVVVVVVAAGVVVVVVAAPVVVVVLGGQGFGEQVPAPRLIPFADRHCAGLERTQESKAPSGEDCTQHWIDGSVVVVVVELVVDEVVGSVVVVVVLVVDPVFVNVTR